MKELFWYNINTRVKEDVTEELEPGKKTITTKIVEKPVRVIIKEQNRADVMAANNVFEEEWANCIRRGLMPRSLINKKYREAGGILTKKEEEAVQEIKNVIDEVKSQYQEIDKKEVKTSEDQEKIKELILKFQWANAELTNLENIEESLYSHAAETIAFQKQLMYNILFLSHLEMIPGKIIPYVDGNTLDEKLENLDRIAADESSDEAKEKARLYDEILVTNTEFLKLLSSGQINKSHFDDLRKTIEKKDEVNVEPAAEDKEKAA